MTTLTTHQLEGDLAVFLIGARILKPWRPDAWFPAFAAMGPMLVELAREPEVGLLHARTTIDADLRGLTVVQYWRSIEDIYRYANDRERTHRPAWLAFYRRARRVPGAVQVWHESYAVPAGGHESLYSDAPRPFGLARATGSITAARRGRTAKERLRNRVAPEPAQAE